MMYISQVPDDDDVESVSDDKDSDPCVLQILPDGGKKSLFESSY